MPGKVRLTYFNGRGKMESIRWLLAAAGVEFEEVHMTKREEFEKLLQDGSLMFQQVPLVEIDGMQLVQTKAILNYIAAKYNLYGKDIKDRVMIDMYSEGVRDVMEMIMMLPFLSAEDQQAKLEVIESKAISRYLPVYEKVGALTGAEYLVGSQMTCADVHLFEATLMLEEKFPTVLCNFPHIQSFQTRMKSVPAIKKFLQPGSQRRPQPDEVYVKTVKHVLGF
ncbi:hypothetical protein JZ751_003588 [Albula glossodonta]|uniref:glutathione transferase n=1 Tax=Albula glossodonta TaxID=121402 RepID=A0A8T2N777_9TELE|nr:hypothetical protein JZ751_003588 [Albula glossodonta]